MGAAKTTPWFPGSVKPARPGVYQRERLFKEGAVWSRYTGEVWMALCSTPESASNASQPSSYQLLRWRGLAQEPKQ